MTIKDCYSKFGGDYEDVFSRLRTEERIEKFIIRFLDDGSYQQIEASLKAGDMEDAFRAAHTLKGIAQNFSFTTLFQSSEELTEALRPGNEDKGADVNALLANVTRDYGAVAEAIRAYVDEKKQLAAY